MKEIRQFKDFSESMMNPGYFVIFEESNGWDAPKSLALIYFEDRVDVENFIAQEIENGKPASSMKVFSCEQIKFVSEFIVSLALKKE